MSEDLESLKARGLTCKRLEDMEKRELNDAKRFREVGFNTIANQEEQIAGKIKDLRKKVCLLK